MWVCVCACVAGVGAMTWSPLACGLISGKYSHGIPEASRAAMKVLVCWCMACGGVCVCVGRVRAGGGGGGVRAGGVAGVSGRWWCGSVGIDVDSAYGRTQC